MKRKIENGQTIRDPTTEDALVIIANLKRVNYLKLEDEAQRLAHILWQEGFVVLEHGE